MRLARKNEVVKGAGRCARRHVGIGQRVRALPRVQAKSRAPVLQNHLQVPGETQSGGEEAKGIACACSWPYKAVKKTALASRGDTPHPSRSCCGGVAKRCGHCKFPSLLPTSLQAKTCVCHVCHCFTPRLHTCLMCVYFGCMNPDNHMRVHVKSAGHPLGKMKGGREGGREGGRKMSPRVASSSSLHY